MTPHRDPEAWEQLPNYCGRCAVPLTASKAVHGDDEDMRTLYALAPAYPDIPDDLTVDGRTVYCESCAKVRLKEGVE